MGLLLKLKNGDTTLKSLRYGNDRPGGGDSGQPFMKSKIPEKRKDLSNIDGDGILRGGILAPLNAAEDTVRLTKYLFNTKSPQGFLFTAKQNLLSRVAPETEATFGLGYGAGKGQTGGINAGIYNPLSTPIQAGAGFLGKHFTQKGLDTTGAFPQASINNYEQIVFDKNLKDKNQLSGYSILQYKTSKDSPTPDGNIQQAQSTLGSVQQAQENFASTGRFTSFEDFKPRSSGLQQDFTFGTEDVPVEALTNRLLKLWDTKGLNIANPLRTDAVSNVLSYGGGPGSILGVGNTNIKFATLNDGTTPARTGINKKSPYENNIFKRPSPSYSPLNIFKGANFSGNEDISGVSITLAKSDPTEINNILGSPTRLDSGEEYLTNINEGNLTDDIGLQPWIKTSEQRNNSTEENTRRVYSQKTLDEREKLEELRFSRYGSFNLRDTGDYGSSRLRGENLNNFEGRSILATPFSEVKSNLEYREQGILKDLIDFQIKLVPGSDVKDQKNTKILRFPAFLSEYSDSYSTQNDSIKYMGRPEPFYKYSGFGRTITFSFVVAAQSKAEIANMYTQLNALASSVAPSYTNAGYMNGNICYLTIGDLVVNQPGLINGFSLALNEETTWDIGLYNTPEGEVKGDGAQLPQIITVSGFGFTPLYDFIPQFGSGYWIGSKRIKGLKLLQSQSAAFLQTAEETQEDSQDNVGTNINQSVSTDTGDNVVKTDQLKGKDSQQNQFVFAPGFLTDDNSGNFIGPINQPTTSLPTLPTRPATQLQNQNQIFEPNSSNININP